MEEQDQEKNIMAMQCMNCKKEVRFIVPQLQVYNGALATILVWGHEKTQSCQECGTQYQMRFHSFSGIALQWLPLQKPQESNIIVAPADNKRIKVR